jgi:hypothetical protein
MSFFGLCGASVRQRISPSVIYHRFLMERDALIFASQKKGMI